MLAWALPVQAQEDSFDPVLPPDPSASYVVSVTADPAAGAVVTGNGSFSAGATTIVSCTPNEGYAFSYWTLDGVKYSTETSFTYTVTQKSVALVAHLQTLAAHQLSVSTNLPNAAEVTGAGEYYPHHVVTVTCTPNKDYNFQHWTLNGAVYSTDMQCTYEMGETDAALVAVFTHTPHYLVTTQADDNAAGTVTAINSEYLSGETITLEATPNTDYLFSHWTLNGSYFTDQSSFTYTVGNTDAAFVAVFDFNPVQPDDPAVVLTSTVFLNANPAGAATFNLTSGDKYHEGDTLLIKATLADDYILNGWYEGDKKITANSAFTYIVGQKSVTFTLRATPIIYSQLNLVASPSDAITFNITSGKTYAEHTVLSLHASVLAGYMFQGWYLGDSLLSQTTDLQYTIGTTATTLVARATAIEPDPDEDWNPLPPTDPDMQSVYIIAQSANTATGRAYGSAAYVVGKEAVLRAVPAHGYVFSRWDDGNTDSVRTIVASVDVTYTAYFTPITYQVTVSSTCEKAGCTATGGGVYAYRSAVTLTATPATGYVFLRWSDDNTELTHTIYITSDTTFTAYFQPISVTIDVESSDMYAGITTGGGEYKPGDTVVIKAASLHNNIFMQWDDGITDNPRTIIATENTSYSALFVESGDVVEDAGMLSGKFEVAQNQYVSFSQGNLQYNAGDGLHACADWSIQQGTWQFAEKQYTYIGTDNDNAAVDYDGQIDIFGWGTSGWNSGTKAYQPWDVSITDADYQPKADATSNLTDATSFADWGVYNAIRNGGNMPETWRTLTDDEWVYLFQHTRWTMARVVVNNKKIRGFMLLPNDFKAPSGVSVTILGNGKETATTKTVSQATYSSNLYTEEQFALLQQAGAVFLPCAGYRDAGEVDYVNMIGGYWSATAAGTQYARGLYFFSSTIDAHSLPLRSFGYSVRLVQDVDTPPITTDIPSTLSTSAPDATTKVLRDGQVLILRGDKVFTVMGVEVK